ncbi:MAG: hydroxyacid dehydrogenase [Erysipelotrichaceae bacterium]|nr:hydroxyacid dehydrogenase [Erysipelotrichaceae bacterium]
MKIAVLEPLGLPEQELAQILAPALNQDSEIVYYPDRKEDMETLIARSQDADIVVLSNLPYPKEVMAACPQLKAIMVAFTGVDHVDMEYCEAHHITVCNCSGYSDAAVSDLVFGMAIGFYRNLAACEERARNHGTKDGLIGYELEGKTFGIIGTGAIGSRVAKIANAFGANVLAYSRSVKALDGVEYVSLEELLKRSDIVSIHVPSTKQTYHMIGEAQLKLMKQDALLINTARGAIVDEAALANALSEGLIAGACVDVLEQEPPFDSERPILHAPNVMITPHIAFASIQAMGKRAHIVADNIKAYLAGAPIHVICQ